VLNVAFVVAISWAYLQLLPQLLIGVGLRSLAGQPPKVILFELPFSLPTYAVLVVSFMGGQIWYGYRSVLGDVWDGTVDQSDRPEIHAIVTRLASAADIPAPSIAVVDGDVPNCFTVGHVTDATIVLTEPLLEVLDDDELETVLAHEIAHSKHRDVTLMTITTLFISIAERAYETVLLLPRAITSRNELSSGERIAADWLLPVLALSAVFVAPLVWLFPVVSRLTNGQLAHQREFAADRGAADITGKPMTLARALIRLDDGGIDPVRTDLRESYSGTQALCFVPYDVSTCSLSASREDIDDEDADWETLRERAIDPQLWITDQDGASGRVSTSTHPPVDERVRRLVEYDREQSYDLQ
jgi:Zn-dependent protease with chaperone function